MRKRRKVKKRQKKNRTEEKNNGIKQIRILTKAKERVKKRFISDWIELYPGAGGLFVGMSCWISTCFNCLTGAWGGQQLHMIGSVCWRVGNTGWGTGCPIGLWGCWGVVLLGVGADILLSWFGPKNRCGFFSSELRLPWMNRKIWNILTSNQIPKLIKLKLF